MENETQEKSHPFLKGIIVLAVIIGIFLIIVKAYNCSTNPQNKDGGLLNRAATNSDISLKESSEASLSNTYKLKPYTDINNLQITITFKDADQKTLVSKTKIVGNVLANQEYSFSFGITEFTFTELASIKYWSYDVTGGTVTYLQ